jgi:hypothetical protein
MLCIALIQNPKTVYYDYGVGENRKSICLNDYQVPPDERERETIIWEREKQVLEDYERQTGIRYCIPRNRKWLGSFGKFD